jgi:hypothetical protein
VKDFLRLCKNYGIEKHTAITLSRMAAKHHAMQEKKCNENYSDADERAEEILEGQIEALIPGNIRVLFTGDPRGYTVKLLLPGGEYNTWGGKECGWGVSTEEEN